MVDDALLADPRALAALDRAGVLRAAATAGAQVRSAAEGAAEGGIGRLAGLRPRALVLLRRPGTSTTAANMLAALLGPACPVPVVLAQVVPGWVGALDVVVVHTADGDDGELAESVGRAVHRGADVVLSAPPDGPVPAAGAGRAVLITPRIPVPPGLDMARALAVGLCTVAALGLVALPPGLGELADLFDAEAERNQPGHEPFMNPAKALALRLAGHLPLLWGIDPPAAAVAGHAAAALAWHAGVVAHAAEISWAATAEGLVRALDAVGSARDVFHDPFDDPVAVTAPRLVLLATGDDDPGQVMIRRTGRPWPSVDLLHPVEEVARGTAHATLLRMALLASRFDAAAAYLGLATRSGGPA